MAEIIVDTYDLDLSGYESGVAKIAGGWDTINQKTKEAAQQNPYRKQADDLLKFNNQLRTGAALFTKATSGPAALKAEVNRLSGELIKLIANQQKAGSAGNWKQTQQEIARVKAQITDLKQQLGEIPQATTGIAGGFGKIGTAIKAAFTATGILLVINAVVEFGKKLIDVTGIGEKYQNQFTRIFEGNSAAAKGYLSTLQTIADTTNYTFDELADNISKLASRGIIPTKKEILGLGDVANFINKDFEQLNEAILDANNSERWKELGFTVKTEGNKMTLAYGDFTKTVDNSVKGAYEAIQAFSSLGKVQGSTAEAGKTLSGRVSSLMDMFAKFFRTIGQGNSGPLSDAIDLLTSLTQAGIDLYRNLAPSLGGLGTAFVSIAKAVGGAVGALAGYDDVAKTGATTSQRFGYYLTKYVINPLTGITLVVSGAIEGINQLFLYMIYASAKLRGDKSLVAALDEQLAGSKKRIADIQKALRDGDKTVTLEDYVKKDNQAKLREERRARLNEEALAKFKPTPSKTTASVDEKAAQKAAQQAQKERKELLENKRKLEEELKKLQDQYDKERLNDLDKNSIEYIELKKKLDLQELEEVRQHMIKMGQELTGYDVKNIKTGKYDKVNNLAYKLPKSTEDNFQAQRDAIESASQVSAFEAAEARAREAFERQQFRDKTARTRQQNELQLELRQQLLAKDTDLVREAGESEIDYENRKNKALLQLRIDYYEKLLKLAKDDPLAKDQVQDLVEQIAAAKKDITEIDKQGKTGPTNLFELLGISFKDEKGNDITDQVSEATSMVIDNVNQVLDQQMAADQARIDSIDRQLEAKQNEIDTEKDLATAGLANNLAVKQREYAVLQAERQKELKAQQTA